MKRKKLNPDQWSLKKCIDFTIASLSKADRGYLQSKECWELHDTLGRWIRNNCGLWTYGTDRCVADIVHDYKAGTLISPKLDENQFTHHELSFDLKNITGFYGRVDSALEHPDNCSSIIIESILQRLSNGTG